MISKIIHYCWFGGNKLPKLAEKCIKSWKKHCPDYEIICWDESNYDLSAAPLYVRQAYEAKKWAFVTEARTEHALQYPNASPEEFLTLLDNAAVVCTSSFHGTAFSVAFGKRFYCVTPKNFGGRTNSLLSRVGLLACRAEDGVPDREVPDYAAAAGMLEALRRESLEFLKDAIEAGG